MSLDTIREAEVDKNEQMDLEQICGDALIDGIRRRTIELKYILEIVQLGDTKLLGLMIDKCTYVNIHNQVMSWEYILTDIIYQFIVDNQIKELDFLRNFLCRERYSIYSKITPNIVAMLKYDNLLDLLIENKWLVEAQYFSSTSGNKLGRSEYLTKIVKISSLKELRTSADIMSFVILNHDKFNVDIIWENLYAFFDRSVTDSSIQIEILKLCEQVCLPKLSDKLIDLCVTSQIYNATGKEILLILQNLIMNNHFNPSIYATIRIISHGNIDLLRLFAKYNVSIKNITKELKYTPQTRDLSDALTELGIDLHEYLHLRENQYSCL